MFTLYDACMFCQMIISFWLLTFAVVFLSVRVNLSVCVFLIFYYIILFYFIDFFFCFKQKTAYEMRISDWSSDVCSSDLRGYKVYKEVCSSCHSMKYIAFRNLGDIGYNEAQVKALAAGYQITDGPNDDGEMFQRPGLPSDIFPAPFANEKAARAANGGAYPPDLSLLAKAREGGPNYIHAILTGYVDAPADFTVAEGKSYNKYFAGHNISMPKPLSDDQVTFDDRSEEHTSELQSLMRISYAVFCLKKKKQQNDLSNNMR